MTWWNDLWLNESFATVMSYHSLAMDTDPAMKEITSQSWLSFIDEQRWAYSDDLLSSNHPIEAPCDNLDVAQGLIDGITYGKGASLLRQLMHFVG